MASYKRAPSQLAEFLAANRREQTLLFVGAGFSSGCQTKIGKIPDGAALAEILNQKLGRKSPLSLQVAAFEYLDQFGADSYAGLLNDYFRVIDASEQLKLISSQHWLRTYTTNYDDAVERLAALPPGSSLSPLNSASEAAFGSRVVHLHGYVHHLTETNIKTDFKLKFDDFDAEIDENLMYMFQRDLANCAGIIFVGYGFNDLDIIRAMRIAGISPNRTLFIQREDLPEEEGIRLNRYGEVFTIGKDALALALEQQEPPSVEPSDLFAPVNFEKQTFSPYLKKISNDDVLSIYTTGIIYPYHFQASEAQPKVVLFRSAASTVIDNYDIGERLVLIHSDVGNGKTAVVKHLLYLLSQRGIECYQYTGGSAVDPREVEYFKSLGSAACLIFDSDLVAPSTVLDYADRLPSARILYAIRSVHIELRRRGGWEKLQQFAISDLNALHEHEIEQLKEIFDTYGLWGLTRIGVRVLACLALKIQI